MKWFLLSCLGLLCCVPAAAVEVLEVKSPGGIRAWLVEEHALPLVAVKIAFTGSGFAHDPEGKEGRAGMAAALLMEGAGDMDSEAFNEALEDHAVRLSFSVDEDMSRLTLESLAEHKSKAFSYLGQALTRPRFDDSAMERVRRQTLSLILQQEQTPGYILRRGWQKLAYGDHPYGQPVLGTREAIAGMTRGDLLNFTRHYLTRQNMVIGVVGDITPEELGQLLDTHLAELPARYQPDSDVPDIALPETAQQIVIDHDIPQTMVMFGTQGIRRTDPDFYNAYVMNQILGGGNLSSRLAVEIRVKRGLAYSAYAMLDPMFHAASWRGGFATRNEEAGAALEVLRATLEDFAQNGPTDEEMEDAKRYITGSFVLNLGSNADIASYLVTMQLYDLGRDYLDRRNAIMNAVRKEDVTRVAKRLTAPDKLLVIMVGEPVLKAVSP